jgi:hypothetical protein
MRHAFVHFDLNTSDFARVRRFYEALFDWGFVDVDMGGNVPYAQIRPPSGPGGGLQPAERGTRSQWVPYVGVDDLRAMLVRVREAGGAVLVDYTEVPGFGAQAIVQDPGGTQLGLWEMVALEPAAPVEEVVEPEIIEDAEVVEQAAGPEVVVDAPAVAEVAPAKKSVGERLAEARRKKAAKREQEAAERLAEEKPVAEEPAAKKSVGERLAEARRKKAAKREAERLAEAKKPVAEEPAAKKESKKLARKGAKKAAIEKPAAAKKAAKKAAIEKPAAAKKAAKKTPGRGRR